MGANRVFKPYLSPKHTFHGSGGFIITHMIYYKWKDALNISRRIVIPGNLNVKIPLILKLIGATYTPYLTALALHTYIYQKGGRLGSNFQRYRGTSRCRSWVIMPVKWSRKEADQLLYLALGEANFDAPTKILLYCWVRFFGWMKWKR